MRPHSVNSSSSGGSSQHHQLANPPSNEKLAAEIRNEIQRFESVHPCIYTVYDLIEAVEDVSLQEQLREQVVNIEDAFVNSQEWTLSRGVHELRLGIVGSLSSGKSSLVHYFLTGTGTTEESPEGGRFKKEVVVGGRSYLLLIRDEGSQQPEAQFTHWLDAVLVVYALESRESYQTALYYHRRMTGYRGMCIGDVPVLLIGTTKSNDGGGGGGVTDGASRAVSEEEARQASQTLKMCDYFECSPALGLNVENIFHNVCQRIVQHRQRGGLPGAGQVCRTPAAGSVNSASGASYDRHSQPSTQIHNHGAGGEHYTQSLSHIAAGSNHPYHSHRERYQRHQYPRVQDYFQQATATEGRALGETNRQNTSSASTFFQNDPPFRRPNQEVPPPQRHPPPPAASGRHSVAQHCQSTSNFTTFLMPSTKSAGASAAGRNGNDRVGAGPVSPYGRGGGGQPMPLQQPNGAGANLLPQYSRSTSNVLMPTSSAPLDGGYYHPPYHHRGSLVDPASAYQNPYLLMDDEECSAASTTTLVHPNPQSSGSGGARQSTPGNTPNTQRKNRRISNLFRGNKEPREPPSHLHASNGHLMLPHSALADSVRGGVSKSSAAGIHMGVGRAIPIKQGLLYKRSAKALNRDWKKKYVCLYPDGRLCYHSSLKDYMDRDSRGKEIYLGLATVKVNGRRGPKGVVATASSNRHSLMPSHSSSSAVKGAELSDAKNSNEAVTPTGGDGTSGVSDSDFGASGGGNGNGGLLSSTSSSVLVLTNEKSKAPSTLASGGGGSKAKKKGGHKRGGGSGLKNGGGDGGGDGDDGEGSCEFEVISCDQKRWEFSAATSEERDDWVRLIEQQIARCLQSQMSQRQQQHGWNGGGVNSGGDGAAPHHNARREVEALRRVNGNQRCADCSAPDPQWASLNLGTLICIECSGIHRNLGTHLSKVRSLELDDWPPEYLCVMRASGNALAAQVWEHDAPESERPTQESSHEQKERWIRMKYEQRLFLAPVPPPPPPASGPTTTMSSTLNHQLVQAVLQRDLRSLLILLPRCGETDLNSTISATDKRTPLHLACSMGAPELLQLLIWAGAHARALDENGRTALWHARLSGSRECISILTNLGIVNETAEEGTGSTATITTPRRGGNRPAPEPPSIPTRQVQLGAPTPDINNGIAAFESLPASAI